MVTVKDIAKHIGLSQSTVSIVLRGDAEERKISTETQRKVWQAAREMGYRVNISARKLRVTDNNIYIAVYWTVDHRSYYMLHFFRGLWEKARKSDRKIEFIIKPYERLSETFEISAMYHGAIVCNASEEDMLYLDSVQCVFPVVIYNRESDNYDTVGVDDREVGRMGADILTKENCKKVLFVTSMASYTGAQVLKNCFLEMAQKAQMEVAILETEDNSEGGKRAAEKYLEKYQTVDAVFCAAANAAQAMLNHLMKNGVAVPEKCKMLIVGSGELQKDESAIVPLSAIYNQRDKLAEKCLEVILMRLSGNTKEFVKEKLSPEYVKRESC